LLQLRGLFHTIMRLCFVSVAFPQAAGEKARGTEITAEETSDENERASTIRF
jgi:hypothetical protein